MQISIKLINIDKTKFEFQKLNIDNSKEKEKML